MPFKLWPPAFYDEIHVSVKKNVIIGYFSKVLMHKSLDELNYPNNKYLHFLRKLLSRFWHAQYRLILKAFLFEENDVINILTRFPGNRRGKPTTR